MSKIFGTNEILGSFASAIPMEELESIMTTADSNVSFVENAADEVHLALPYYSVNDKISTLASFSLSDEEMAEVVGGEIGFLVAIMTTTIIAGGTAGGIAMAVESSKK